MGKITFFLTKFFFLADLLIEVFPLTSPSSSSSESCENSAALLHYMLYINIIILSIYKESSFLITSLVT